MMRSSYLAVIIMFGMLLPSGESTVIQLQQGTHPFLVVQAQQQAAASATLGGIPLDWHGSFTLKTLSNAGVVRINWTGVRFVHRDQMSIHPLESLGAHGWKGWQCGASDTALCETILHAATTAPTQALTLRVFPTPDPTAVTNPVWGSECESASDDDGGDRAACTGTGTYARLYSELHDLLAGSACRSYNAGRRLALPELVNASTNNISQISLLHDISLCNIMETGSDFVYIHSQNMLYTRTDPISIPVFAVLGVLTVAASVMLAQNIERTTERKEPSPHSEHGATYPVHRYTTLYSNISYITHAIYGLKHTLTIVSLLISITCICGIATGLAVPLTSVYITWDEVGVHILMSVYIGYHCCRLLATAYVLRTSTPEQMGTTVPLALSYHERNIASSLYHERNIASSSYHERNITTPRLQQLSIHPFVSHAAHVYQQQNRFTTAAGEPGATAKDICSGIPAFPSAALNPINPMLATLWVVAMRVYCTVENPYTVALAALFAIRLAMKLSAFSCRYITTTVVPESHLLNNLRTGTVLWHTIERVFKTVDIIFDSIVLVVLVDVGVTVVYSYSKFKMAMALLQGIGLALGVQSILHECRRTAEMQAYLKYMCIPPQG